MKKMVFLCFLTFGFTALSIQSSNAQCSICTRTAQQLGEKPARGLNAGIIYLAATPFLIGGYVFYRWKRSDHD